MKWYLRGCLVCGGDLYEQIENPEQAACLMCAREFPVAIVMRPGVTVEESDDPRDFLGPLAESRWRGVAEAPHPGERHADAAAATPVAGTRHAA
ncbi:MAG: hypothetical protein HYU75_17845 [Betaproteobacteria bacterium]|nr:hypothetical protein [Betaproteobacteria bacterium]